MIDPESIFELVSVKPKRVAVEGLPGVYMTMSTHAFNKRAIVLNLKDKGPEADRLTIALHAVNEAGERIFKDENDPRLEQFSSGWGMRFIRAYSEANEPDDEFVESLAKNSEADRT